MSAPGASGARVIDLTYAQESQESPEAAAERLAHLLAASPLRQQRGDGYEWVVPCPLHDPDGTGRKPDLVIQPGETRPEPSVFCRHDECGWPDVRAALLARGVPDELLGPAGKRTGPTATRPLRAVKPTPAVEPIDERTVQDWHSRLVASAEEHPAAWEHAQATLAYLHGERGLTDDTLRAAQIGWDGERITLPVADKRGRFVNVRRYHPRAEQKMMNLNGYGSPPRWYGADALVKHVGGVLVCEGEWDRLVTQQHFDAADYTHMLAVSGTHGARTLPADLEPLRGRRVYVAYDCDDDGQQGAAKLAGALDGVAGAVYVVDLGLDEHEDLTDWFVKYGRSADDLLDRLQIAEPAVLEAADWSSWGRVPLAGLLDGTHKPLRPSVLHRDDGQSLLYAGKVHSAHGESESGNSWLALLAAAEVLSSGLDVLYLDFESDAAEVSQRLLLMGIPADVLLEHLDYRHPETPLNDPAAAAELTDLCMRTGVGLVVVDGVTDAMGTLGLSLTDNDDVARFLRELPKRLARGTGAPVLQIDHVTKDADSRGRWALGGQHKMAGLDGAAYTVEVRAAFGRGMHGVASVRVGKDRPGVVRGAAGVFRKSDRTQLVAEFHLVGADDGTVTASLVVPPQPQPSSTALGADSTEIDAFRPTGYMQRASKFLAGNPDEWFSMNAIVKGTASKDKPMRAALRALVDEGLVERREGSRRAVEHKHARPYREAEDPAAGAPLVVLQPGEDDDP